MTRTQIYSSWRPPHHQRFMRVYLCLHGHAPPNLQASGAPHGHLHEARKRKRLERRRVLRGAAPRAELLCHVCIATLRVSELPNHEVHVCQLPQPAFGGLEGVQPVIGAVGAAVL